MYELKIPLSDPQGNKTTCLQHSLNQHDKSCRFSNRKKLIPSQNVPFLLGELDDKTVLHPVI